MPTVATYYQLHDDPIDVSTSLTLNQVVADTPAGGEGALVTWSAASAGGTAGFVTYSVEVNGNPLGDYAAFQGAFVGFPDFLTTVQEAAKTTDVKKGGNTLKFTVTSTTGDALRLRAVMLWHRVNV